MARSATPNILHEWRLVHDEDGGEDEEKFEWKQIMDSHEDDADKPKSNDEST